MKTEYPYYRSMVLHNGQLKQIFHHEKSPSKEVAQKRLITHYQRTEEAFNKAEGSIFSEYQIAIVKHIDAATARMVTLWNGGYADSIDLE